jgi:thymidylate kinase
MFELRPLEYHEKVRKLFLSLEGIYPGVVKAIDVSSDSIEKVHEKIKQLIIETNF